MERKVILRFFTMQVLAAFLFLPVALWGQNDLQDVVYLKSGNIVRGTIYEMIPDQSVRIRTREENLFFFKMDEIAKMTREQPVANVAKLRTSAQKFDQNLFLSLYGGLDIASLIPDQVRFCNDLAAAMNSQEGFSGFSFQPKSRYGFTAGFSIYGRLAGPLFLQTELAYKMKGMVLNGRGTMTQGWTSYNVLVDEYFILNYLNIPVYAKLLILDKGRAAKKNAPLNLYLQAGPSVGIAIAKKMRTDVTVAGNSSDNTQNFSGFEGLDFSLDFGAGIELIRLVDLEFRYSWGVKSVLKEGATENTVLKNSTFSLLLGFTWPVGN